MRDYHWVWGAAGDSVQFQAKHQPSPWWGGSEIADMQYRPRFPGRGVPPERAGASSACRSPFRSAFAYCSWRVQMRMMPQPVLLPTYSTGAPAVLYTSIASTWSGETM